MGVVPWWQSGGRTSCRDLFWEGRKVLFTISLMPRLREQHVAFSVLFSLLFSVFLVQDSLPSVQITSLACSLDDPELEAYLPDRSRDTLALPWVLLFSPRLLGSTSF